jgi:surface polysaccharide O-acyltransferase-like enzyme
MKQPKGRILYFDILNVIACMAVIFLHHNGLVHNYSPQLKTAWSQALIVEVVGFFAVPVFLMISGATLMEYRKRYDTRTFFQKRLSRVLLPFIIWSIITFLFALWRGDYTLGQLSFRFVWDALMSSQMMAIYWFFPVIISIYLAMPVLSLLTQRANRKWLWYMVGVGVVTYSILPPILKLLGLDFNTSYQLPLVGGGGFIIYPILGYLLATEKIKMKWFIGICVAAVAALALRYGVTYLLTIRDGSTNHMLFDYIYFTGVLPSVALFILVQRIPWNNFIKGRYVNVLTAVSSCSLGIYLIHILVMDAELKFFHLTNFQLLWRIAMPLVTYGICLSIVWIVKSGVISRRLFP